MRGHFAFLVVVATLGAVSGAIDVARAQDPTPTPATAQAPADAPVQAPAAEPVDTEAPPWAEPVTDAAEPSLEPAAEVVLGPAQPARILATLGGGISLRLVRNIEFSQEWFAPGFVDLSGAYIFPTSNRWRHGAGLSFATNTSGDGSSTPSFGLYEFEQFVLAPAYVAYYRLTDDIVLLGDAALPISMVVYQLDGAMTTEQVTLGLEASGGAAYMVTAGLGAYAALTASVWAGADSTFHPVVSAEVGAIIDYEVLP